MDNDSKNTVDMRRRIIDASVRIRLSAMSDEELAQMVTACKSAEAEAINLVGREAQIDWLLDFMH